MISKGSSLGDEIFARSDDEEELGFYREKDCCLFDCLASVFLGHQHIRPPVFDHYDRHACKGSPRLTLQENIAS